MPEITQPTHGINEKKSRGLGSYVLLAFVAVMAYVLSSGPYIPFEKWYTARHRGYKLVQMADIVYAPLFWAYHHTPLREPLDAYWRLWHP